jgi:hypothetical protein
MRRRCRTPWPAPWVGEGDGQQRQRGRGEQRAERALEARAVTSMPKFCGRAAEAEAAAKPIQADR